MAHFSTYLFPGFLSNTNIIHDRTTKKALEETLNPIFACTCIL